jgi:hypothetical protein
MARFVKESFCGTEYVEYRTGTEVKFVARFKRGGRGPFLTFLIKNFTVEEYFSRLDAGEAPLTILQSKGYLQPHIKKWLKEGGYEVSPAGFEQMVKNQTKLSQARAS